ncbi:MAG: methionyl-tRNA formyltransferase [Clostridia bacterium]|nr:methionyl-tRNA formyltransferase [Clostridia bacterium]
MRILFMGTPDFAKRNLEALYNNGENIVGVVTAPDKPKGRGMVLTPSDVKKFALKKNLTVYQPTTLKDGAFLDTLKELDPELIIVVAYGKILPGYVLDYPKYGCINNHASILPKYRGAAPIQRAIMDGDKETGVSVMKMDIGLDTGDVILVERVTIEENDNFESVHDKLAEAGSIALLKTVDLLKKGEATYTKQPDTFTYAEKILKSDCLIDFNKSLDEIHNQIRGLSPIPLAFTKTPDGKILKVVKAHKTDKKANGENGEVVALDGAIFVKCANGVIALDTIVPEGKGKMNATDLINGRKVKIGDKLGG